MPPGQRMPGPNPQGMYPPQQAGNFNQNPGMYPPQGPEFNQQYGYPPQGQMRGPPGPGQGYPPYRGPPQGAPPGMGQGMPGGVPGQPQFRPQGPGSIPSRPGSDVI